ncbi:uncharacterized protein [Salminus brasiliensis]|uniref:uncharacterized protein isoform X2 n=1 Tax=Salminus brasiliensis TaxID=930266 RepID=UPI003B830AD0
MMHGFPLQYVTIILSICHSHLFFPPWPPGTTMDRMLRAYQNVSRKAYGLFKVDRNENNSVAYDNKSKNEQDHLTWAEEFQNSNLILDPSRKWIIVEERGVYLIYLQVTYTSKIVNTLNSDTLNLELFVDFNYTEGKQEFSAAFDTQKLTENTQEAHLSIFFLLHMNPKEKLAVRAYPVDKISNDNTRPISSYITIVRYADW